MSDNLQERLMGHLDILTNQIGPRPIGTLENKKAAEYIRQFFHREGLYVEEHHFECPNWQDLGSVLSLGDLTIACHTNFFSPACSVNAVSVGACTIAELEQADLTGKVAILYGELTKEPLTPKDCPLYQVESHQKIIQILEEKQPAAIVTITPSLHHTNRIFQDWDFKIPSITVLPDQGLTVLNHIGSVMKVLIRSDCSPSNTSTIIARKTGKKREKIVMMAHYDTTFETPGALDNGGGMAVLLELAHRSACLDLDTGLEYIAFSEHEYGGYSDPYYVEKSGDEFQQILAAINYDAAGYILGTNTIMLESASPEFRKDLESIIERYPGVDWIDPWPQSNHSTFSWRGIPAMAFTAPASWGLTHLPLDTMKWISPKKLEEVLLITEEVVLSLQGQPLSYTRAGITNE